MRIHAVLVVLFIASILNLLPITSNAQVFGCNWPTALNYDPAVTDFDGSCIFQQPAIDSTCIDASTGLFSTIPPAIAVPANYPTDVNGNFTFCVDEASSMLAFSDPAANGNLPDNNYMIEFNGERVISANATFDPTAYSSNLQAGDTIFITAITYDLDSINNDLTFANSLCPLLDVLNPDILPCSDTINSPLNVEILFDGDNDGNPGINSFAEVISFANSLSGDVSTTSNLIRSLYAINEAIIGFGAAICFGVSETIPVIAVACSTPGCTDVNANNYNAAAVVDDGTCEYLVTFNVSTECGDFANDPTTDQTFTNLGLTGPNFGWCGGCNNMTDPDMDGIYSITLSLVQGSTLEYKYQTHDNSGGWINQEQLVDDMVNGASCAPITDFNAFANRQITIGAMDMVVNDFFGFCDGCPATGCTDAAACNFDAAAVVDDGSCTFNDCEGICGGTAIAGTSCDDNDVNTINDVYLIDCSCAGTFNQIDGCTNINACNYNSAANTDDGSCILPGDICDDNNATTENDVILMDCTCGGSLIPVLGCLDVNACNYNATANTDDGSCTYLNVDNTPFSQQINYVCTGDEIDVTTFAPTFNNSPTNICYFVHTNENDIANSTIMSNSLGVFANNDINTNQILYVSIAGDNSNGTCPDVANACTEVFNVTTIGFLSAIQITNEVNCPEVVGDFNVTFQATGGSPSFPNSSDLYTYSGTQSGTTNVDVLVAIGPIADGSTYSITVQDQQGCTASFTSELIECNKLPIELINFTAIATDNGNKLNWETATEINNDYFTISKFNLEDENFEELIKIEGNSTNSQQNSYEFLDYKINGLTSLYKLSQTDFDGNIAELGLVELKNKNYNFELTNIQPNPVKDNLILSYKAPIGTEISINIFNSNGKMVYSKIFINENIVSNINLNTKELLTGLYNVVFYTNETKVSQKIIKY